MNRSKIVIVGLESDKSTRQVSKWISRFGFKVDILNFKEILDSVSIANSIHSNSLGAWSVGWYRRDFDYEGFYANLQSDYDELDFGISYRCINDINILKNQFFTNSKGLKWLSSHKNKKYNKLEMLDSAVKCNLEIPDTLITNSKAKLDSFLLELDEIILKPVSDNYTYVSKDGRTILNQKVVKLTSTSDFPEFFFPAIFQAYISKSYEIRCFVLKDRLYSAAILNNDKVDCRQNINSVRIVPYIFSSTMKKKILNFMESLECDTGSLDFVVDENDRVIFLEMNPNGQYDFLSKKCNYYIDKEVARTLINMI